MITINKLAFATLLSLVATTASAQVSSSVADGAYRLDTRYPSIGDKQIYQQTFEAGSGGEKLFGYRIKPVGGNSYNFKVLVVDNNNPAGYRELEASCLKPARKPSRADADKVESGTCTTDAIWTIERFAESQEGQLLYRIKNNRGKTCMSSTTYYVTPIDQYHLVTKLDRCVSFNNPSDSGQQYRLTKID